MHNLGNNTKKKFVINEEKKKGKNWDNQNQLRCNDNHIHEIRILDDAVHENKKE